MQTHHPPVFVRIGLVRSIGVSNYLESHIIGLLEDCGGSAAVPSVNQVPSSDRCVPSCAGSSLPGSNCLMPSTSPHRSNTTHCSTPTGFKLCARSVSSPVAALANSHLLLLRVHVLTTSILMAIPCTGPWHRSVGLLPARQGARPDKSHHLRSG